MKRFSRWALLTIFGFTLISFLIIGATYEGAFRNGELKVEGITSSVIVRYDQWGIPHITSQNSKDAFFALGYVQAQDRILQMEMTRRLSQGRLSEVVGDKTADVDIFFRTLGIDRYSHKLAMAANPSDRHIQLLQAYLDGINQFLKSGRLPMEAKLLPTIRPFTLTDTYSISSYMAFSFDRGLKDEIFSFKAGSSVTEKEFLDLVGRPLASRVHGKKLGGSPSLPWDFAKVEEMMDLIGRLEGSNSVLVSPQKSSSGGAILANDTHIKFSNPSVWYEASIQSPDLEIYGHFLPAVGLPILGHNSSHGWGVTIFHNDDIDLIPQTPGPQPHQIIEDNEVIELEVIKAQILRKDKDPLHITLYQNELGPDVRFLVKQNQPVIMRWGHYQQRNDVFNGIFDLIFADNIAKAEAAVHKIDSPSLNIHYANSNGDIAWWTTGQIKKSEQSFEDFILKSDHPHSVNPSSGFIFSTNHPPSKNALGQYSLQQRRHRIEFLLENSDKISIADIKQYQGDEKIDYHYPIVQTLKSSLSRTKEAEDLFLSFSALKLLEEWKGEHDLVSIAPTIFYQFCYELAYAISQDELGSEVFEDYVRSEKTLKFLQRIIKKPQSSLWDNKDTLHQENRDEIVYAAWRATLRYLEQTYGTNIQDWTWGRSHTLYIKHLFSDLPLVGFLYDIGPFAISGGKETLNNMGFGIRRAPFRVQFGPATRRIIDFSKPSKSLGIIPTGQSERALDKHFKDQLPLFRRLEYRDQLLSIESGQGDELRFTPISKTVSP